MKKRVCAGNRVVLVATMLTIFLGAYALPGAVAQEKNTESSDGTQSIGVIPFFRGMSESGRSETVNVPVERLYFYTDSIAAESVQVLTDAVYKALENRHDIMLPLSRFDEIEKDVPRDETRDSIRTLAIRFGQALGAGLVCTGTVWRYKERVGGALGIQSPASVGFAVYLFDVKSKRLVWRARFEETQRSLSEDLLGIKAFLERGAKWITAAELARYGVKEMFKKYPLERTP